VGTLLFFSANTKSNPRYTYPPEMEATPLGHISVLSCERSPF